MTNSTLARIAGFLYLIVAVAGGFAEYTRTSLTVTGDAAATAANVARNATLFRAAFAVDLLDEAAFVVVGLLLYALLRAVNPRVALAMLLLNAAGAVLQAANMLNHVAALLVATDGRYTAGLSSTAIHGLVLFFLELHRQGYFVAQIFFGGYLLPLGYLVYRSGMFPRALGIILALGGAAYLAGVAADVVSPGFQTGLATPFGVAGGLAETAFLLWLLIAGAREPRQEIVGRRLVAEAL